MSTYASPSVIKQKSGVGPEEIPNVSTEAELDSLISALNERASSLINEFCRRDFELHGAETAVLDGNGRQRIQLSNSPSEGLFYPILSISQVVLNDKTMDPSDYRIASGANSLPGRNAGILERRRARWPEGWENIEVTLDWGFADPPGEIKDVAESLVVDSLRSAANEERYDGASSVSMDGFSVSLREQIRLGEEHRQRLQPFRRLAL